MSSSYRTSALATLLLLVLPTLASAEITAIPLKSLPESVRGKLDALFNSGRLLPFSGNQNDAIIAHSELQEAKKEIAEDLIGNGFDVWKGVALSEGCAKPNDIRILPLAANGKNDSNISRLGQIETSQQHHENRSSGVGFDLTYELFSFGLGSSSASSQSIRSTSKYIDIYKRAVGDEFFGSGWAPTDTAVKLINEGEERFAQACGQRFISKVGFGLILDAQLGATVEVDESADSDKTEVEAGFGDIVGISADTASAIKRVSEHSTLSVSIKGGGGEDSKPEAFIDYARSFGAVGDVQSSFDSVFIETRPYHEIAYKVFAKFDDVLDVATGTVLRFQADRLRAIQQLEELKTAIAKPQFYQATDIGGVVVTDLAAESKLQTDFLDKLGKVYQECRPAITPAKIQDCQAAALAVGSAPRVLRFALIGQT